MAIIVTMEYVEYRLYAWGRWARTHEEGADGYPRRTVEARLVDEGGVLISGTGPRPLPVDSGAEQIERLVTRLQDVHPKWPEMLRKYYCADLCAADTAREIGVSTAVVKDRWLPMARHRIAGALEGGY